MKRVPIKSPRPSRNAIGVAAPSSLALMRAANAQVATVIAECPLVAGTSEPGHVEGQAHTVAPSQSDPVSANEGGCPDELPARLESKGAGPDVPLTTNDSAAGRQENRRIELRVIQ